VDCLITQNGPVRRDVARVPRFLLAVPGILAGIFVPVVVVTAPKPAPPQTVGMSFMDFTVDVVKVHVGDRLTFVNSSNNIHAIGPGKDGQITSPVPGDPLAGFSMLETNAPYTTTPWLVPGKYYVTCSLHPMMNLTVVVVR
jgi:plastocyanin